MATLLRRRLTNLMSERGAAALEFAIMAPLLLILIISVVELGLAIRDSLRAQAAAAAGGYYAMQHGFNSASISAAVANGAGTTVGVSASPAPVLFCGCPTATGIGSTVCGATCTDGVGARQYVQVSASITRTTLLNAHLGLPAVLIRKSVVRLP
jgi:Flp pilus assembly protein TadG